MARARPDKRQGLRELPVAVVAPRCSRTPRGTNRRAGGSPARRAGARRRRTRTPRDAGATRWPRSRRRRARHNWCRLQDDVMTKAQARRSRSCSGTGGTAAVPEVHLGFCAGIDFEAQGGPRRRRRHAARGTAGYDESLPPNPCCSTRGPARSPWPSTPWVAGLVVIPAVPCSGRARQHEGPHVVHVIHRASNIGCRSVGGPSGTRRVARADAPPVAPRPHGGEGPRRAAETAGAAPAAPSEYTAGACGV